MLSRYPYHGGVWVDLERPTEQEVHRIAEEFSIGERLETELFSSTPTPLVARDAGFTFLVLHFPAEGILEGEVRDQEVDIVVGPKFILTVRYEVVPALRQLQKILETQQTLGKRSSIHTEVLLEIIFAHLYTGVRDRIVAIADNLNHIEHEMFNGNARRTVRSISNISREFLHIEASLVNQEEPLHRFLKVCAGSHLFGEAFEERAERIRAERAQVSRLGATYRAVATELRETNSSLLESRQNEIMKTLTVITFGVMPLELIALIFGIHAGGTPFEGDPNAFFFIMLILLGVSILMFALFARRHWFS